MPLSTAMTEHGADLLDRGTWTEFDSFFQALPRRMHRSLFDAREPIREAWDAGRRLLAIAAWRKVAAEWHAPLPPRVLERVPPPVALSRTVALGHAQAGLGRTDGALLARLVLILPGGRTVVLSHEPVSDDEVAEQAYAALEALLRLAREAK